MPGKRRCKDEPGLRGCAIRLGRHHRLSLADRRAAVRHVGAHRFFDRRRGDLPADGLRYPLGGGSLSFWLGLFVFLFLCLIFAQQLWLAWRGSRLARISARSILYWVSVVMAWGLVYLAAVRGSPFRGGFEGEIHRTGHWLLYFLDNVLRVVLLDVFEIFEIQFSGISPGTWYARTITVFLRIMITAGLLDLALSTRKYYFDVLEFTGTVRECYVWCDSLPEFDPGVMLVQVSRLESLAEPHAVEAGDFLAAFKDRAG